MHLVYSDVDLNNLMIQLALLIKVFSGRNVTSVEDVVAALKTECQTVINFLEQLINFLKQVIRDVDLNNTCSNRIGECSLSMLRRVNKIYLAAK